MKTYRLNPPKDPQNQETPRNTTGTLLLFGILCLCASLWGALAHGLLMLVNTHLGESSPTFLQTLEVATLFFWTSTLGVAALLILTGTIRTLPLPKRTRSSRSLGLTLLGALALSSLPACTTYTDAYGQQHSALSPAGGAILQAALATGTGAASGALMRNQPGWMNGAVSGLSGSVVSQLVSGFIPIAAPQGNQGYPPPQPQRGYPQRGYQRGYSQPAPQPSSYQPNYYPEEYYQPASYPQARSSSGRRSPRSSSSSSTYAQQPPPQTINSQTITIQSGYQGSAPQTSASQDQYSGYGRGQTSAGSSSGYGNSGQPSPGYGGRQTSSGYGGDQTSSRYANPSPQTNPSSQGSDPYSAIVPNW